LTVGLAASPASDVQHDRLRFVPIRAIERGSFSRLRQDEVHTVLRFLDLQSTLLLGRCSRLQKTHVINAFGLNYVAPISASLSNLVSVYTSSSSLVKKASFAVSVAFDDYFIYETSAADARRFSTKKKEKLNGMRLALKRAFHSLRVVDVIWPGVHRDELRPTWCTIFKRASVCKRLRSLRMNMNPYLAGLASRSPNLTHLIIEYHDHCIDDDGSCSTLATCKNLTHLELRRCSGADVKEILDLACFNHTLQYLAIGDMSCRYASFDLSGLQRFSALHTLRFSMHGSFPFTSEVNLVVNRLKDCPPINCLIVDTDRCGSGLAFFELAKRFIGLLLAKYTPVVTLTFEVHYDRYQYAMKLKYDILPSTVVEFAGIEARLQKYADKTAANPQGSADEQSAEDQPTDAQPADAQFADDQQEDVQLADEQPDYQQPLDAQPLNQRLLDGQPVDSHDAGASRSSTDDQSSFVARAMRVRINLR
jgi:hypothetical protein